MIRSLYSGVTGVRNHQLKMDVVGNNIANVNTIGFKSGRITFTESLSQLLKGGAAPRDSRGGVNPVQIGLGVKVQSVDNNFGQGGLESTGYATDLAIQGRGFFIIKEGEQQFYTRAGNFSIDANGRLVAGGGFGTVQGFGADSDGVVRSSTLEDVVIPLQMKTQPKASTEVVLYSNLDSDATMAEAAMTDAGDSGVTSVVGTADDGIGGTHTIRITNTDPVGNPSGNATQSSNTGTNAVAPGAMQLTDRLVNDMGVNAATIAEGFDITMDAGTDREITYNIRGLTNTSTVGDLLNLMRSQVPGGEFELVGGEIQVTRKYAGDGSLYSLSLADSTSDVVAQVFGAAAFNVNDGNASSLVAVDTFVDNANGDVTSKTLELVADSTTGLMTQISGLGEGGITILADGGLQPTDVTGNDLVVETEDTEHSTTIQVFDEQGKTHNLTVNFTKTSQLNEWKWEASVPEPATAISGAAGAVEFNTDGTLRNWTYENNRGSFTFDPGTSESPVSITFDPGTIGGMDGITQTASGFSTTAISQDGYAMGTLEAIDINANGEVTGSFTNGQEVLLAEIAMADFNNTNGLKRAGDNLWESTDAAGDPIIGLAENNFNSRIDRGFLEMSNVDLVKEFTEMITAQRGFQANSRVITTSDQILQEVTNLKR